MIRTTLLMASAAVAPSLAAPHPIAQASYGAPSPAHPAHGVACDPDGLFRVEGRRGTARISFVVDTGATATVLSPRDAARPGVAGEGAPATLTTAGGQAAMRWGRLDRLRIAGRVLPAMDVVVAGGALPHSPLGQDAIAALGRLTFERDRMEIAATSGR